MTKEWPRVHVSKKAIRRAGEVLRDDNASKADRDAAREITKAWRSAHQYPVNTWQVRLRGYVKGLDALVAQRMKRISSMGPLQEPVIDVRPLDCSVETVSRFAWRRTDAVAVAVASWARHASEARWPRSRSTPPTTTSKGS